jgi:dolichyl-phosphate-mannose-protein mannosyltransferase
MKRKRGSRPHGSSSDQFFAADVVRAPMTPAITRRESILLTLIIAAGVLMRLFALSRSAVEHFDEGVYASNIYFIGPEYAYPQQRFYAPPLLPALIEAGMIAGLPPNVAALLPSFLAGCGTIVAMWWFGRSWFGPAVGLSAATLLALSDFHIAFSAAALTDALLGLWLVLAVDAVGRSLANRRTHEGDEIRDGTRISLACASGLCGDFRWAVGAGIYTGLAWWTKYNGWLPLAIEGAGLALLWLLVRPPVRQWINWLGCFAVTCIVACVVWSSFFFSLQSQGGYGPIAANHAKYVVGLAGWVDSAVQQISNQVAIGIGWSSLGLILAIIVASLLQPKPLKQSIWLIWTSLCAGIGILVLSDGFAIACGAAIGIVRMVLAWNRTQKLNAYWERETIAVCLILAWWGGMVVSTPLYTPYARLALPCLLSACLAASLNWAASLPADDQEPAQYQVGNIWGCVVWIAIVAVWFSLLAALPHSDAKNLSTDRRGLLQIAKEIRQTQSGQAARVVYVYGEPALYFQLRAAREDIVAPVQEVPRQAESIDGKAVPTFLVVGPHAQGDAQFQQQWAEWQARFELVKAFDYAPSAIVWLDLHDPRKPAPEPGTHAVRLYRFKP